MVARGSYHAIHNADVPGSSPGVATIFFKGLAQANPFLFWSADYKPTTNRLRPPLPIYGSHKKPRICGALRSTSLLSLSKQRLNLMFDLLAIRRISSC